MALSSITSALTKDLPTYIDIHTHKAAESLDESTVQIRNVIVSVDSVQNDSCSAGIHPWHVSQDSAAQLAALRVLLSTEPNILAIGECGLDKVTETEWKAQEIVFEAQLQLAQEFGKPLIIHCVRAYQEVIRMVNEAKNIQPVIIHGFNKNKILAEQLLQQQFYLSLGADLLRGNQDELIKQIPLERLFLETDTSSISISEIYTYFCRIRKMSLPDLQDQIWANFARVFNKYLQL